MKRLFFAISIGLILLTGGAFLNREPLLLKYFALNTAKTSLQDHINFIRPYTDVLLPDDGVRPYPLVIQLHGCAGQRREFHEMWARIANGAGYAVMLVDSLGPRNIDYDTAMKTVCEGRALLGQERAGDILAAIKIAEADGRLDTSRLVLAGWSHGGWALMDYLTMDLERTRPAGISRDRPVKAPDIDGAFVAYPYCGPGALSRLRGWREKPAVLALIAGKDTIVDPRECIRFFTGLSETSERVDFTVYQDADHIFDDPTLRETYPQYYNRAAASDAMAQYKLFLEGLF